MNTVKVENMKSSSGNEVPNQFKIYTDNGVYFQSYNSIVAFRPIDGKVKLDEYYWNYSRTTGKYRNKFLRESRAETEKKIEKGEYELTDLN